MTALLAHTASTALLRLDLQQRCRAEHIPTLSVLVGHNTEALAVWQDWATRCERQVLLATADNPLQTWLYGWLQHNKGFRTVAIDLAGKTHYELATLLAAYLPKIHLTPHELRALHRLLQTESVKPDAVYWSDSDPLKIILLLSRLVDDQCLPALAVTTRLLEPEALNALIRQLYRLASACPVLPIALLLEPPLYRSYKAAMPNSREKAWVLEGRVNVSAWDATMINQALLQAGVAPESFTQTINDLAQLAPSAAMVEHFVSLASSVSTRTSHAGDITAEDDDQARSHAERLLFECLQRLPETKGLFRLNARLPVRFGNTWLEIDLYCESHALAVEIDGYYHFQNVEAYRRDRRKDVLLQKQGYLIVRFLADDIVSQLEVILSTIKEALAHQQQAH